MSPINVVNEICNLYASPYFLVIMGSLAGDGLQGAARTLSEGGKQRTFPQSLTPTSPGASS